MEPNEPHFNLPFLLIITVSCLVKGVSMESPETTLNPPLPSSCSLHRRKATQSIVVDQMINKAV